MRRRLAQAAHKRNASVNQEIVKRLEDSFALADRVTFHQYLSDIEQATHKLTTVVSRIQTIRCPSCGADHRLEQQQAPDEMQKEEKRNE